jgi:RsiW-degrading membrane proteinase PrsW (M82 family)
MPILFTCTCGKTLRADESLAGRRTRCPQCETVLKIPSPEVDDGLTDPPAPAPPVPELSAAPESSGGPESFETEQPPSTFIPARTSADGGRPRTISKPSAPRPAAAAPASGSIREYAYLILVLALIPLVFSLLKKDEGGSMEERLEATLEKATPEQVRRVEQILSKGEQVSLEELLQVMPEGKLLDAHLPRDSAMHWIYAAIATAGFLILTLGFFSVERANPLHLLGIGLFTGTVGIVFLLAVQFCSQFRLGRIHGGGWLGLIMLILAFIGWSYRSALDPGSNFFLSALGYTFGVGLCEELTKAIPLFFYFQRDAVMGWRGACLWGLASGVGFGVSEGIMYSGDHYNGISGGDIYIVRFVSCVALHAMWAASVGIAISRNIDDYEKVSDQGEFAIFMLRMLAVPMVLHGLYDTLLKMEMNVWALVVAVLSFGWLAVQIEAARAAQPGAGARPKRKLRPAY